jgi:hypothetical protein
MRATSLQNKNKMERNSIVFYRSFFEAMKELEPKMKSDVFDAIMEFSFSGKEIELTGISKTVFILIKPQLQANMRRYENGMKPKRKREAEEKQEESETETNKNKNKNKNENTNDKFVAPSLQEVETFFAENNFKLEVARNAFHYYNEANWKDSRGKSIQNWKQKMRGVWFKDDNKNVTSSTQQVYTAPKKYRPA